MSRKVSVQLTASSLAGLTLSAPTEATIGKIVDGNIQVALEDGSKVWRTPQTIGDIWPGEEDEAGDTVSELSSPIRGGKAGRRLQRGGMRASRRISFLRKSKEAVTMTNIEQAECVIHRLCVYLTVCPFVVLVGRGRRNEPHYRARRHLALY